MDSCLVYNNCNKQGAPCACTSTKQPCTYDSNCDPAANANGTNVCRAQVKRCSNGVYYPPPPANAGKFVRNTKGNGAKPLPVNYIGVL